MAFIPKFKRHNRTIPIIRPSKPKFDLIYYAEMLFHTV